MYNLRYWKNFGLLAFGVFATLALMVQSLGLASTKNFWIDEVYEIMVPLSDSTARIITNGARATPSPNPFYFVLQKIVLPHVLKREASKGHGYDWRITFRIVPAATLAFGIFMTFLFLLGVNKAAAAAFVMLVPGSSFALWYGAETRIYGTWLGMSALFYAVVLFLAVRPSRFKAWLVFLAGLALSFTAITSALQVLSAVGVVWLLLSRHEKKQSELATPLITACVMSVLIFIYYRYTSASNAALAGQPLAGPASDPSFGETLKVMGGGIYFTIFILVSLALPILSVRFNHLRNRRFYSAAGLLSLSQIGIFLLGYLGAYAFHYSFGSRHGIFLVASEKLVVAAVVAFIVDMALEFYPHFIQQNEEISSWIVIVIVVLCCNHWFQTVLQDLPMAINKITLSKKPYCNGMVSAFLGEETNALSAPDLLVRKFNLTNENRHGNKCEPNPEPSIGESFFDFKPVWIYGPRTPSPYDWSKL